MQQQIKITLPKLGESIVSATVVQWFKKEGDQIRLDEPLLEVSTDKINSEIPSSTAGILQKILVSIDQEVQVGEVLAIILVQDQPSATLRSESAAQHVPPATISGDMQDFLSPSVMRLIQEKGLKSDEIHHIPHTGHEGRLTKKDIEEYVYRERLGCVNFCGHHKGPSFDDPSSEILLQYSPPHDRQNLDHSEDHQNSQNLTVRSLSEKTPCPMAPKRSDTERVKMSALRKAIADNMVRSFYEAPHASLITEVDVTALVKTMQAQKASFLEKHGCKLTITAFVARAMARAVEAFPLINASLEGDTIVMKRFVNLGIAVSVDQGVMVPVIKDCQNLSLPEISQAISHLAEKARTAKLAPLDIQEGTLTVTNFGMTGTMIGVPIIRYPEVAIVGLGAITKKVAAMEDDSIAIRSVMWISLTFDHRVLDGMYGCGFLGELKGHLESDLLCD